jgi:CRP-like cAMP-binding protein
MRNGTGTADQPTVATVGTHLNENEITDQLKTVRLERENQIFKQEKTVDNFYLVRQGLLGIYRHVYPDKKVLVHKIGPGESTGLAQAFSDHPFPGQLIPIKETVAYEGRSCDIDRLAANFPSEINRLLAEENTMHNQSLHKIDDIIGKDLEERIASELLDLASRIGRKTELGIRIIVKLTRKQISDMIGCTQESVIRIMSDWETKDWVTTNQKYVTIQRPHRLRALQDSSG